MAFTIVENLKPVKDRLERLLEEVRTFDIQLRSPTLSNQEPYQINEFKERFINEKVLRLQMCIESIEELNKQWLGWIQKSKSKKEDEVNYAQLASGDRNIFVLKQEAKDAIITLTLLKEELEQKQTSKESMKDTERVSASIPTVNLPQLNLLPFTGNPREWRQFWSCFEAAVHSQPIPQIQKLNYLYTCLKGKALQAVAGYDIAPENYEIIRQLLINKYGDSSTLSTMLYNEFQIIKRNEKEWAATIENMERVLRQLEAIGEDLEHRSIETLIEGKLPSWIMNKVFAQKLVDKPWNVSKLRGFLMQLVRIDEQVRLTQNTTIQVTKSSAIPFSNKRLSEPQKDSTFSTIQSMQSLSKASKGKRRPCLFCSRDHWDSNCDSYPTLSSRLNRLKILKKCAKCLMDNHSGENCKKLKPCFYCKKLHPSALCDKRKEQNNEQENEKVNTTSLYNSTFTTRVKAKQTLLMCKEITVFNSQFPRYRSKALALFDTGSQLSFVSEKLANCLKLPLSGQQTLKITPFGTKQPSVYPTTRIQLNVQAGSERITIGANVVSHLTNEIQVVKISNDIASNDITSCWRKPDILIGADYFFQFITLQKMKKLNSGYMLIQSKVGPMVIGTGNINKLCKLGVPNYEIQSVNVSLNSELERFWKLETIGIQETPIADDDDQALQQFKRTIMKKNGRYEVRWPWRDSLHKLSNNYGLCLGRLRSLIPRLQHRSLLQLYHDTIMDQFQSGIIEEVPTNDEIGIIHYLPHHEVVTPSKTTTKLRIVYDASAHLSGYKSLNEVLYRGPIMLPDLVGVLLRFRMMKIVITADIEKAFLQLGLQAQERNCTRFLWLKNIERGTEDENIKCYRFKRVPFGVTSSPFLLAATLNFHLENLDNSLADEIRKNLYVDNITISAEGTEDALQKYREMKEIFGDASMNIREFLSNDKNFNTRIPKCDLSKTDKENFLGIVWNHKLDIIRVVLKPWIEKAVTKRTIVRFLASQYDPLGFLVPSMIQLKVFIQHLWKKNISWDQQLDERDEQNWKALIDEWPMNVITLPRFVSEISSQLSLHVFTDASKLAYSAAVYMLLPKTSNLSPSSNLLYAKSRIAPIKSISTPRLELLSILIGVRAAHFVLNQLNLKDISVTLWSDSKCALYWVKNHTKLQPRFIQNRVDEIRKANFELRYVPGEQNPADVATRGLSPNKLRNYSQWWEGPQWLNKDRGEWPQGELHCYSTDELSEIVITNITETPQPFQINPIQFIDENRFSNWTRLVRVTVWILRFIKYSHRKTLSWLQSITRKENHMTKEEYKLAERMLIRQAQSQKVTKEEIEKWNLYQEDDLWRSRSRLEHSELQYEGKYPLYLPNHHRITDLIIAHHHVQLFHAGVSHTLSELRQRFWIPKGRAVVKRVISLCRGCQRWRAKSFKLPPMSNLPESRVTRSRTFQNVGLDYMGPLSIKANYTVVKRWIALFTCFTTRAVHLEPVEDLSAEKFLHVLRRFIARRGHPTLVMSDNANQFQLVFKVIMEENAHFLASKGIIWRNIIPKAPWSGGVYERIIALTKKALRKAIGRKLLKENEFITLITEVEGILNTRPLTYVGFDDYRIIRPIDFISPSVSLDIAIDNESDDYIPHPLKTKDKLVKYWNNILKTLDVFWKIWREEYLTSLRERTQREIVSPRSVTKKAPHQNEIVLLGEPEIPRGKWRLAKVVKLNQGSDGRIRSAMVQLPDGKLLARPINMLYPLEIDGSEDSNIKVETTPEEPVSQRTRSKQQQISTDNSIT